MKKKKKPTFPLTKVAAICVMRASILYALVQPCLVSSSIHIAPPLKTKPFVMVGETRCTNGGSNLKKLITEPKVQA